MEIRGGRRQTRTLLDNVSHRLHVASGVVVEDLDVLGKVPSLAVCGEEEREERRAGGHLARGSHGASS